MSETNSPKLSLNVFLNKHKSKLLFAEANSDVVDILLSFLALPLGRMARVLEKHYCNEAPVIGSITSLYRGLSNLDATHFSVGCAKQMLVNPRSSFEAEFCRLKLDISDCRPTRYFICQDIECPKRESGMNITMHSDLVKCECGMPMNREIVAGDRVAGEEEGGVFTIKDSSFIICDDLRVVPVVAGFLQTLNSLGITDADRAEMRCLSLGIDDIMDLLKFSLISATPLSDFIIKDRKMSSSTTVKLKPEQHNNDKGDATDSASKMTLKVSIQKSTNKFLFAQATNEFADLLCSFLSVPLGRVEHLFGGKTKLKSIDNLYRSVTEIEDKYFATPETKSRLVNPKLAHGYITKFLPLVDEETPSKLYYKLELFSIHIRYNRYLPMSNIFYHRNDGRVYRTFKWIDHVKNYVKEQKMCIVRDDLAVTPYSVASSFSILDSLGVLLSDVREMELHIGMEEALSLLKASLTSRTAITDALINPMLNKPTPTQEAHPIGRTNYLINHSSS